MTQADTAVPVHIARWAMVHPDRLAVSHDGTLVTYGDLYDRSRRLAGVLRLRGVGQGTRVALVMERSPDLVIAALAVMMAGGAYVSTDINDPDARLQAIVADSAAPLVITQAGTEPRLQSGSAQVLTVESLLATAPPSDAETVPALDDPCYVTYTSGSSGTPKGVLVTHGGLANLVQWYRRTFDAGPGDRITQLARPSFDAWALEVWPCLSSGATLCIREGRLPGSPADLAGWLAEQRATICFLTTTLAVEMFDQRWGDLDAVPRLLLLGGERLVHHPPAGLPFRVFNLYGPTEATVVATYTELTPDLPRSENPPIGRPLPGMRAYVLDKLGGPVPSGTAGELHIAGVGVAAGYLNRPELTAERFITDPFVAGDERMYATGDLVRELPGGTLAYVGRVDDQLKLRGFRIEPGEIEAALRDQVGVREAVVVKHERGRLVGYVVPDDVAAAPDPAELRQGLTRRLPDYMVPQAIVVLEGLPVTSHGKTDRAALTAGPLPDQPDEPPGGAGPQAGFETDAERALAELWCDVLEIGSVRRDDSFFELGGDSLLAMRLVTRARERGLRLGAEDLFEYEVLHELAASITEAAGALG